MNRWQPSWTMIGVLLAGAALTFGGGGLYAGWKANISQAAIDHEVMVKHLAQSDRVWDQVRENAALDAVQQSRLEALERQHEALIARLNDLINLMWKDEVRRQERRGEAR